MPKAEGDGTERQVGPRVRVTVGGVDVSASVETLTITTSINAIASAAFAVKAGELDSHLDWQGEVRVVATKPVERAMFTGVVTEAKPDQTLDRIQISCRGGGVVLEEAMADRGVLAVPGVDAIHWLLRHSDWPDDRMDLQGIEEELPREVFEVVATVEGLAIAKATQVGDVRFIPSDEIVVPKVEAQHRGLVNDLISTGTVALVHVDAWRTFDAEAAGLGRIDVALAWLDGRAQDGSAIRGSLPWAFRRVTTQARPRRGRTAFTRGCETERFILFSSETRAPNATSLSPYDSWAMPPLATSLRRSEELAILAWSRANQATITEQRVQALWDAMEYYAASTSVPRMFESETLDLLVSCTTTVDLTLDQRERVVGSLRQLNAPPLMVRMRHAAENDGVALNVTERELLARLRRARNRASHGRQSEDVRAEDLRHGLSLVARLLAARVAGYRRDSPTQ